MKLIGRLTGTLRVLAAVLAADLCYSFCLLRPSFQVRSKICLSATKFKMLIETDVSPPVAKREVKQRVILKFSTLAPRLPCMTTPQKNRIRLAELMVETQSPIDLWAQKLLDTKRDIDLHLNRLADEAAGEAFDPVGIDEKIVVADGRGLNEVNLQQLLKKWELEVTANSAGASASADVSSSTRKPRVVVMGSGWGAHAVAKIIDTKKFEAIFVSPRSYFIFTPMLASSSVGTVEYRSICEPMRSSNPFIDFYEAAVTDVDSKRKVVTCVSTLDGSPVEGSQPFEVSYDYLVLGIGMQSSTFNIPGVEEHCFFLKEVNDAKRLRAGIVAAFERAALPGLSEEELRRRLAFVVVGGGPTGVEFSGELFDFLQQDLKRYYPRLVPYVSTTMLQSGDGLLEQFDSALQELALASLRRDGTNVVLGARVTEVRQGELTYRLAAGGGGGGGGGEVVTLPHGLCVWACGNQPRPLAKRIIQQLQPDVASKRGRILTDAWLRAVGSDGSIFAIGDAAEAETAPLPQTGQVAAQQGAYVARLLNEEFIADPPPPAEAPQSVGSAAAAVEPDLVGTVMRGRLAVRFRPAAVAGDEVARAMVESGMDVAPPFQFVSLGILAYLGGNNAVAKVEVGPAVGMGDKDWLTLATGGWAGWILWRSVYLTKQVAFRNRVLVLFDWVKSKVFGRDIACL